MKVGKALVVGDVWLYSVGKDEPIAHVVGTYSIPPDSLKNVLNKKSLTNQAFFKLVIH